MKFRLTCALFLCHLATSARADESAAVEFFERKVRPILAERCYQCHSQKAKALKAGLLLDDRDRLLAGGDSGPAVTPGEPDASLLIEAIRYDGAIAMPPAGKLAAAEIETLTQWVKLGAAMPASQTEAKRQAGIDIQAGRQFWSFRPVRKTAPPKVANAPWPSTRLDSFVLAELEQHGLVPSAPADRRTLARRLHFDVIGLPPSTAQLEQFLTDERPDAYERLVDRLLASPEYGERWSRHWLDLARYTDATDSWLKSVANAYLYRDWVIRAFNEDLHYNEFVRRQLAADSLPGSEIADQPALGFLGLSPTYWKELKLDHTVIERIVADEWEERIDTVGRTFLGLTIACARCHDHKFDPITTRDYYALAGVFASSSLEDRPMLDEPTATTVRQARKQVDELQEQLTKLKEQQPAPKDAEQKRQELSQQIERIKRATPQFDAPTANVVAESALFVLADGPDRTKLDYRPGVARDLAVQLRGNPTSLGEVVPRRFLEVLSAPEPSTFRRGSGRLELANAIVSEAAPLAARVIVNRLWKHHFGRGIVDTPSDFGAQGDRPSHPALLDDLAARFIENDWSIKWLQREILCSSAYRQSSAFDETKYAADPDNRWLWRMSRRRLNVEEWRDALLAGAGQLDRRIGGPPRPLDEAGNHRRTVYALINRRDLADLLRAFDYPDANAHSPNRTATTTPLQQLFVLNGPFVQQQARDFATRIATPGASIADTVQRAYSALFGRPATPAEIEFATEFFSERTSEPIAPAELWRQYAQALLASNEFLFID